MRHNILKSYIRSLCTVSRQDVSHQVCIVGAGPAGFYAAYQLLRVIKHTHKTYSRLIIYIIILQLMTKSILLISFEISYMKVLGNEDRTCVELIDRIQRM